MEKISFYSKRDCPLCDTGLGKLVELAQRYGLEIEKVDIENDAELLELVELEAILEVQLMEMIQV